MAINLDDTRTMLAAIDRGFVPTTTLVDTFFPNIQTFNSKTVDLEYREGARRVAPFVVPGAHGVNIAREGSVMRSYTPPIMKPARTIEPDDVARRGFGENVYSTKTAEERANELRAQDLSELIDACVRRQEVMAGQLLTTGKVIVEGYADDGQTVKADEINYGVNTKTLTGAKKWDATSTADIYGDLAAASRQIRREAGLVPSVAIVSPALADLIINNEALLKLMMIPSRDNMALASIAPKIVRPDLVRVGRIDALGLEIYSYDGIYVDNHNEVQSVLPEDYIVIGVPGKGKRLFGAVTQVEDEGFVTYAAPYVPKVINDKDADVSKLIVTSRCVLAPESNKDFMSIKVK